MQQGMSYQLVTNTCTETILHQLKTEVITWQSEFAYLSYFHMQPTASDWQRCWVARAHTHHAKVTQTTVADPAYETMAVISSSVPTQVLKQGHQVARSILSYKDKISQSLNISKERLQSGFGLLKHERKYVSFKEDGRKMFFPQHPSALFLNNPASLDLCKACWEKTRKPTTFSALNSEQSWWTENTKNLHFPSCCFSSALLGWHCFCWQIWVLSPQTNLNTQKTGHHVTACCASAASEKATGDNITYSHPEKTPCVLPFSDSGVCRFPATKPVSGNLCQVVLS